MVAMNAGCGTPGFSPVSDDPDHRVISLLIATQDAAAASLSVIYVPDGGATAEMLLDLAPAGEEFFVHEPVSLETVAAKVVGFNSRVNPRRRRLQAPKMVAMPASHGEVRILIDAALPLSAYTRSRLSEIALDFGQELDHQDNQLHKLLHRAAAEIAQASASELEAERVMDVMLEKARSLLRADVAYLSRPADDATFKIQHTHGIRTRRFQNLRVPSGDALGGKAAKDRAPVISLNYLEDPQLMNAKLTETRDEGIISALAVPVLNDTDVEGVLYVGNRAPRGYTQRDASLLSRFSELSMVPLNRFQLDERQRERIIVAERAGIARRLHDTVVRQLTELSQQVIDSSPSHSDVLQSGIAAIRDEIHRLSEPESSSQQPGLASSSAPDILSAIYSVPGPGNLRRDTAREIPTDAVTAQLPQQVAEALVAVGQEAVFNADLHSGGQVCTISIAEEAGTWKLRIADDGSGFCESAGGDHFGIIFMETVMAGVGGTLMINSAPEVGTEIVATWKGLPDGRRDE